MLTIEQAAKLLRVSERTLHNWEAGRVRIPYAAYKLIRILRGYELPGESWQGYRLIGDTLWSPENLPFRAADARWWSLTVCMAHEFKKQAKERQAARAIENGARAKVEEARNADPLPAILPKTGETGACISGLPLIRSKEVGFVPIPAAFLPQNPFSAILPPPREGVDELQSCSGFPLGDIPSSNTGCINHTENREIHAGGAA